MQSQKDLSFSTIHFPLSWYQGWGSNPQPQRYECCAPPLSYPGLSAIVLKKSLPNKYYAQNLLLKHNLVTVFLGGVLQNMAHSLHHTSERRRQFFRSFEAKSLRSRSLLTQISDDLTAICGSSFFLMLHIVFFSIWIGINMGLVSSIAAFDPFPFGLLTMIVSLEAIFLAIFILVSQNRSSYIGTLRDEFHLRVNLIAEEEITKILEILAEIRKEMGIKKEDPQLKEMLERIDTNYIERSVLEQMSRANKPLGEQLKKDFPELMLYPVTKPVEIIQHMTQAEENSSKAPINTTAKR